MIITKSIFIFLWKKKHTTYSGLLQKLLVKSSPLPSSEETDGALLDSLLGGDVEATGLVTWKSNRAVEW